jgi:uncharacterized cupin superfamily protein
MPTRPGCVHVFDLPEEDRPRVPSAAQGVRVRAGSFVGFPPGPAPHHFIASGAEALLLLEGGERRPHEDSGWYVELGMRYILSGRAQARVGDVRFEVGPGDFMAHPSGGAAHTLEVSSELEYLMGGMRDPEDIVRYLDAGVMKRHGALTPIERS